MMVKVINSVIMCFDQSLFVSYCNSDLISEVSYASNLVPNLVHQDTFVL